MDFDQRQRLVRRICDARIYGTVNFNNQLVDVTIIDPTLDILSRADYLYEKIYKELIDAGDAFSIEESYSILEDQGIWSSKLEAELKIASSNLENLKDILPSLQFKKNQYKSTKQLIEKTEQRISELSRIKNSLYSNTANFFADKAKKRYIISKVCFIEDEELINNSIFQDTVSVYYYIDNAISAKKMRELARSDPWRLYWIVSKDTGTPLFKNSCVEMTDLQYALTSWTRIYDFAFSSENRPDFTVIEDDDAFDAWYKAEEKRITQTIKQNKQSNTAFGGAETFIPADLEGSKEVYSLNDLSARARIKEREKAIDDAGELKEAQLPDVKRDLKMELNRMAMQKPRS